MKYLPIFFNVRQRPCLVVGGGDIAARKVEALLRAGAKVTIVSPKLCPQLHARHGSGEIIHVAEAFAADHLDDCALVVAATSEAAVNVQVSTLAQGRNIPVNVVDRPDLCTFVFPSIIDRSPGGTGGALSPRREAAPA